MPRHVTKTYGRSQKASNASKVFDDLITKDTRPSTAMTSSTMAKWGKTTFTSTRDSQTADTRKRKVEPEELGDDPFSFDSDDEGPKNPKRGMGFKVDDKKTKQATNGKTISRDISSQTAAKKNNNTLKIAQTEPVKDSTLLKDVNTLGSKAPARTYSRMSKASRVGGGSLSSSQTGSIGSSSSDSSNSRQLSMDSFTRKLAKDGLISSSNCSSSSSSSSKLTSSSSSLSKTDAKPCVVRKFFTSSQASQNSAEDHNYSFSGSSQGSVDDHTYSQSQSQSSKSSRDRPPSGSSDSDFGNYDSDWDHESGDPEIVFNSPKKKAREAEDPQSLHKQAVRQSSKMRELSGRPVVGESPITISSDDAVIDCETDSVCSEQSGPPSSLPKWKKGHTYGRSRTPLSDADSKGGSESPFKGVSALVRSSSDGAARLKKIPSLERKKEEKKEKKTGPIVRRLLTSPKKGEQKAVYNARVWNDDEEEASNSQNSTSQQSKKTESSAFDDDFDDDVDAPTKPLRKPARMKRMVTWPQHDGDDTVTSLKITKPHKPLYTVVRNVKEAHEVQEYGETQEFHDEIEYIMDGLQEDQSISVRCLSAVSLAMKCTMPAFRMHLRAHGTITQIFKSLHDAPQHPPLALCTAAVMYMLSRDRLNMDLEQSHLELMVALLSSDPQHQSQSEPDQDFEKLRFKIRGLCDNMKLKKEGQARHLELEEITTGHLATETLLSLTSRKAGDWFKEELRTLGGLDHIINVVSDCLADLDEFVVDPTETMLDKLTKISRCLRVLENVTYLNSDNQNYLITYESSKLLVTLCRTLKVCENCLPFNEVEVDGKQKPNKDCPGYIVFSCLLGILRVLLNLTHDNRIGSTKIGSEEGLIKTVLSCVLSVPQFVPMEEKFDLLVLGLGLLINIVEHSTVNRGNLIKTRTVTPYDAGLNRNRPAGALEALTELFNTRHAAARLMELEHDEEMEQREREKSKERARVKMSQEGGNLHEKSGEWRESESGLEWVVIPMDDLQEKKDKLEAMGDIDSTSSGDTSNDLDVMPGSQEEDETFTKALHKMGKHMEDSIVAAYVALLVGCTIQGSETLGEEVREYLPEATYEPMIRMLKKFLGFMNFTTMNSSGGKSISRIIEVLEMF